MSAKPTKTVFAPDYEFPTTETLASTASPAARAIHEKTLTIAATHLDAYAKRILEDPNIPAERRPLLAHEALGFAKAVAIFIAPAAYGVGQLFAKFLHRVSPHIFTNH